MTAILIGVDDGPGSEDAVAFARLLAAASGATVVLACAFPYDDTPSRFLDPGLRATLKEQAEETLRGAAARLDGVDPAKVKTVAVASISPPRALDRLAESERAELIVLGSTHSGRLRRVFPGSTAERLLHGAPCPVAVVPRGYGPPPTDQPYRIGVAYDGSKESAAALHAATRIARGLDARVRVIGVLDADRYAAPALLGGPDDAKVREGVEQRVRDHLESVVAELSADAKAAAVFAEGDAVRELASQSAELDLLIAGSRGYGPARSVLLGGVTGRLIREAACPLIIVPRGHEAPLGGLFDAPAATAS